jgi:hypothetical protein
MWAQVNRISVKVENSSSRDLPKSRDVSIITIHIQLISGGFIYSKY